MKRLDEMAEIARGHIETHYPDDGMAKTILKVIDELQRAIEWHPSVAVKDFCRQLLSSDMESKANPLQKMKLPIWLKMFANSERSENSGDLDREVLARIVRALMKRKSVVILQHGNPIEIRKADDGTVSIQQVSPNYVFE